MAQQDRRPEQPRRAPTKTGSESRSSHDADDFPGSLGLAEITDTQLPLAT
jgi:hypothetical protein